MATTMKDPHAGDPLDKDAIIRQQWAIIRDQRLELAELKYRIHHHELLYTQPWDFFFWKLKTLMFGEKSW
jgi:hypothetical protein